MGTYIYTHLANFPRSTHLPEYTMRFPSHGLAEGCASCGVMSHTDWPTWTVTMKERHEFISKEVQHMQNSAIGGQKMPATTVTTLAEEQVTGERTICSTSSRDTTEAIALGSTSMPDVFDEAVVWVDSCTVHSFLASDATVTLVRTLHFRATLQPHPLRTQSFYLFETFLYESLLMRTVRIVGSCKEQAIWTASICLRRIENFASEVCSRVTKQTTDKGTRAAAE